MCASPFSSRLVLLLAILAFSEPLPAAQTSAPLTDADNDTYVVMLTGPGTFDLTQVGGGAIDAITLHDTTHASTLKIEVTQAGGNGNVPISSIAGTTPLKAVLAPASNLAGVGINLPAGVGAITVADVGAGAVISSGESRKLRRLKFIAGNVGAGFELSAPAQTLTFTAISVSAGGAAISARSVGAFKVTAGGFAGVLVADRKIVSFSLTGGDLIGTIVAPAIGPIRVLKDASLNGGNVTDSLIAALKIGPITIAGNLTNTKILAGAQLGDDHALGGSGNDADVFNAGSIGSVRIGGNVATSIVGAGYTPYDGVFGDANDGIYGGARSKLGKVTITGLLDNVSRIGAGKFGTVSVAGARVNPKLDPRFVTRRLKKEVIPPNPAMIAKPVDATTTTTLADATAFLYTGRNPIQTGVVPGTIKPARAAVLRGIVRNKTGAPLPGVSITTLDHAEFGETHSRADGMFDMAVNGGGVLVVKFEKDGFCPVQRQIDVAMQDFSMAADVTMVTADAAVTAVEFGTAAGMQMHEATMQSDADGDRQATLMFTPGTSASLVMDDGSVEPMTMLNIRATEFTVGADGAQAMPAMLPATSAYTYCVDLTADEAVNAGATRIEFDKPVWFYVENFLDFPAGNDVPSGFFNRETGLWEAGPSGKVIAIVSITGGAVDLDVTGDGNADTGATLTALGITDAERQHLAVKYATGQSLWRIPIPHFSPWDANWPFGPPPGAEPPKQPKPESPQGCGCDDCVKGSIIEPWNQILGEAVDIVGTPFALNYRSNRTAGHKASRQLRLALKGATLPASVKRIELEVEVVGRRYFQEFATTADDFTTFEWDGFDAYGRVVNGQQPTKVRIGYVYDGSYTEAARFGYNGTGVPITGDRARSEIVLSQTFDTALGALDLRRGSVGGWTFDVHHVYDPLGRVLYQGDGNRRVIESVAGVVTTFAGTGVAGFSGDGGPATQAQFSTPGDLGVAPDGSIYISDGGNRRIRRVAPDGIVTTIAGTGEAGYDGDGGPALNAKIEANQMDVGPDGSIYFEHANRIRKIDPNGVITTIAGTGAAGASGNDGPALAAAMAGVTPQVAPDGTVYFGQFLSGSFIRRITTDGIISKVAGTSAGFSGDSGPALTAQLNGPIDVVIGPDGSLYTGDTFNQRIRKITPGGIISTYGGGGSDFSLNTDGGPAASAGLALANGFSSGTDMAIARDGTIYFTQRAQGVVRQITPDGILNTLAGTGVRGFSGDGGPARQAQFNFLAGLEVGPDGSVYTADISTHRIRRIAPPLPGFTATEIAIPSEDGAELFRFDSKGRHLTTLNAFTGETLLSFTYDADGQLVKIKDHAGDVTTIQRTSAGAPVGVVGPFGQRTTLTADVNGNLTSIVSPGGAAHLFSYNADGLLTSETDPANRVHLFTYDAAGRLVLDDSPGTASQSLSRVDFLNGNTVTLQSALGVQQLFKTERLSTGAERRTRTDADGFSIVETLRASGIDTIVDSAGVTATRTQTGDPRFGFLAPITKTFTLATPGGKTLTLTTARTATLATVDNPLSVTNITETQQRNGRTTTTTFDAAARTFETTTAVGRKQTIVSDEHGEPTRIQLSGHAPETFTYDARDRPKTVTFGEGAAARVNQVSYNAAGFVASATDPLNAVTQFTYDADGRVTKSVLPGARTLNLTYDAVGNLTGVTPPGGALHQFTYTEFDEIASYTAPGAVVTTFEFNADRKLANITRPGAQTIDFAYDAAGRPMSRTIAAGATTFAYSATNGFLTTITSPDGATVAFTYDGSIPLGTTWTGTVAGSLSRTIDNDLRTATLSVNGTNAISFTYDNDSLVTGAGALTLSRSATTGLVTGTTLDTIGEAVSYNEFAEPTSVAVTANASALFSQQFTYDKIGRITQKIEAIGGTTRTFDYSYDSAERLSEVKQDNVTTESYGYDANGNRTTAIGVAATFDAQDRLTQSGASAFSYTAAGDLLTKTVAGATTTYTFDALGNLTAVVLPDATAIEYIIDGENRRIGRRVNGVLAQGYLYQDDLQIAAELDGSNAVVSRFVYPEDANVPAYMVKAGVTYRLLTEQNGSVRLVVNSADGSIAQRLDYDAFGRVLLDTNPGFQPFGFAGGLYDPSTKLVRFGRRDYDAEAGRWTAKDPLLFESGDTNLYAYVSNDPINSIDPTGLCPEKNPKDKKKKEEKKRLTDAELDKKAQKAAAKIQKLKDSLNFAREKGFPREMIDQIKADLANQERKAEKASSEKTSRAITRDIESAARAKDIARVFGRK